MRLICYCIALPLQADHKRGGLRQRYCIWAILSMAIDCNNNFALPLLLLLRTAIAAATAIATATATATDTATKNCYYYFPNPLFPTSLVILYVIAPKAISTATINAHSAHAGKPLVAGLEAGCCGLTFI